MDDLDSRRALTTWKNMINRCGPNAPCFKYYGGRGIVVCARWLGSFEAFFSDMGPPPAGLTLDRIDNDRGYEPSNCRWVSQAEQNRNRSKKFEFGGRLYLMSELGEIVGIPANVIAVRMGRGMRLEDAVSKPYKPRPLARKSPVSKQLSKRQL